jgi:hypothetical protein
MLTFSEGLKTYYSATDQVRRACPRVGLIFLPRGCVTVI